jgi:hypothetical protein
VTVETFLHDDDGFGRWLREHPTGFVVHQRTKKLHVSYCEHIDPSGYDEAEMTAVRKICGDTRMEVELWARREGLGRLLPCESCEP